MAGILAAASPRGDAGQSGSKGDADMDSEKPARRPFTDADVERMKQMLEWQPYNSIRRALNFVSNLPWPLERCDKIDVISSALDASTGEPRYPDDDSPKARWEFACSETDHMV